jgi:hypothetical protein
LDAAKVVRHFLLDAGHQSRKNRLGLLEDGRGSIGVGIVTLEKHTYIYILVVVRFDCKKNCQFDAVTKKNALFGDVWKREAAVAYKNLAASLKKDNPKVLQAFQRNLELGTERKPHTGDTSVSGARAIMGPLVDDIKSMVKSKKEVRLVTDLAREQTKLRTQSKKR